MKNRKVSIYSLTDPRDKIIKYIGKTVKSLPQRYKGHIYQWTRDKGRHNRLNSWIKSLANLDLKPEIDLIDECNESNWKQYERGYIALIKACGANLKNSTNGGDEPPKNCNSEEAKRKRLETLKTSKAWQNHKIRHSQFMKDYHKNVIIKRRKKIESPVYTLFRLMYKVNTNTLDQYFSDNFCERSKEEEIN